MKVKSGKIFVEKRYNVGFYSFCVPISSKPLHLNVDKKKRKFVGKASLRLITLHLSYQEPVLIEIPKQT